MGNGLHLTGCESKGRWPYFVMSHDGHFPPVHDSHQVPDNCEFASAVWCELCGAHRSDALIAPCKGERAYPEAQGRYIHLPPPSEAAFNPEPWQLGETYMYQEPEPVDRWPTPTRWERFRARIKMWYRRAFGMEWRL